MDKWRGKIKDYTAGPFKVTVTNPSSAGVRDYSQATLICPDLVKENIYIRFTVWLCSQRVQGASNARTNSPYTIPRCQGPNVAAGDQHLYTKHSEPHICYLTWDGTEEHLCLPTYSYRFILHSLFSLWIISFLSFLQHLTIPIPNATQIRAPGDNECLWDTRVSGK